MSLGIADGNTKQSYRTVVELLQCEDGTDPNFPFDVVRVLLVLLRMVRDRTTDVSGS